MDAVYVTGFIVKNKLILQKTAIFARVCDDPHIVSLTYVYMISSAARYFVDSN